MTLEPDKQEMALTGDSVPDTSLAGMLDLSGPLQTAFQMVLREGDMSAAELAASGKLEDPENTKMYLDLLTRLGYLEKYVDDGTARYRSRTKARGKKTDIPEEIWQALEK